MSGHASTGWHSWRRNSGTAASCSHTPSIACSIIALKRAKKSGTTATVELFPHPLALCFSIALNRAQLCLQKRREHSETDPPRPPSSVCVLVRKRLPRSKPTLRELALHRRYLRQETHLSRVLHALCQVETPKRIQQILRTATGDGEKQEGGCKASHTCVYHVKGQRPFEAAVAGPRRGREV